MCALWLAFRPILLPLIILPALRASVSEMQHSKLFWHERSRPPLDTGFHNCNASTFAVFGLSQVYASEPARQMIGGFHAACIGRCTGSGGVCHISDSGGPSSQGANSAGARLQLDRLLYRGPRGLGLG